MKPQQTSFKLVALLLSFLVLMQSCAVYTYKKTRIEEAVSTESKKYKLWTDDFKKYYFDKIERENGHFFGYTSNDSNTAKKLIDQIVFTDEFGVAKIRLNDDQINKIYVYREASPTMLVVSVIVSLAFIYAFIDYAK